MKLAVPLALFALHGAANALYLQRRQPSDGPPRVLRLDLHRNAILDPVGHDRLRRRTATVNVDLDNYQTLYFFNASVGTPAQELRMHLDTGSSDLWVNTPKSDLCSMRSRPCAFSGEFSPNKSTTYEYINSKFNISYADGSSAAGDYVTDTLRFGGANVSAFQFGIGYESTSPQNVIGIGYPANEVQVVRYGMSPYDNLPARLAADGIIASNTFSLWLNDLDADTGSILFGGVDASRYHGDLVTVPIQKVQGAYVAFFITMTGLNVGTKTLDDDMALAVLLDSGSSFTYLPNSLTKQIYNAVDAVYQNEQRVAFVPCSLANENVTMTFKFSSPAAVAVPMNELVLPIPQSGSGDPLTFDNGEPACFFGILPADSGTSVLGDTFLRSAYAVFDLDNNSISLAQTKFNATESDVVEITKGASAIPSSKTAENPVPATSGLPMSTQGKGTGSSNDADDSGAYALIPSLEAVVLPMLVGLFLSIA
ncbi:hypothetical protein RJ55_01115 [Drechmeria coniospora]|nr:hypothetical protein RJ55_01115 [Drechmeria coniospora]